MNEDTQKWGDTEPQVPLFTDDLTGKIAVNKGLCPIGEGR